MDKNDKHQLMLEAVDTAIDRFTVRSAYSSPSDGVQMPVALCKTELSLLIAALEGAASTESLTLARKLHILVHERSPMYESQFINVYQRTIDTRDGEPVTTSHCLVSYGYPMSPDQPRHLRLRLHDILETYLPAYPKELFTAWDVENPYAIYSALFGSGLLIGNLRVSRSFSTLVEVVIEPFPAKQHEVYTLREFVY